MVPVSFPAQGKHFSADDGHLPAPSPLPFLPHPCLVARAIHWWIVQRQALWESAAYLTDAFGLYYCLTALVMYVMYCQMVRAKHYVGAAYLTAVFSSLPVYLGATPAKICTGGRGGMRVNAWPDPTTPSDACRFTHRTDHLCNHLSSIPIHHLCYHLYMYDISGQICPWFV